MDDYWSAVEAKRVEMMLDEPAHCVRCGEPLYGEIAEVHDGVVHVPCMDEDEEIA